MSQCQNCHNCEYKARIPGDAHISCEYPYIKTEDRYTFSMLAISQPQQFNEVLNQNFGFTADIGALRQGYFTFPLNFDPTWMNGECNKHSNILPKKYVLQQIFLEESLKKQTVLFIGVKEKLIEDSEQIQEVLKAYEDAMNFVRNNTTENIEQEKRNEIRDEFVKMIESANELFDKNDMITVINSNEQLAKSL